MYTAYNPVSDRRGAFGGGNSGPLALGNGDFDIAIDGDLVLAGIAAAGAAFFWTIYNAITAGKRKRRKRSDGISLATPEGANNDDLEWNAILPSWLTGKIDFWNCNMYFNHFIIIDFRFQVHI